MTIAEKLIQIADNTPLVANAVKSKRGKNLIPFPYKQKSGIVSGITFTVNDDGSVHYEGTATANAQFHFTNVNDVLLVPGETYTVSIHADSNTTENAYTSFLNVNYKPVDRNPASWKIVIYDTAYITQDGKPASRTAVYPADGAGGIQAYIHVPAGNYVNNTVRLMIEVGDTATEYEPYKAPQLYEEAIDKYNHIISEERTLINRLREV